MARHPRELLLKETIHIQMTPAEEQLNRDTGLELPGIWVAALRRQEDIIAGAAFQSYSQLRYWQRTELF